MTPAPSHHVLHALCHLIRACPLSCYAVALAKDRSYGTLAPIGCVQAPSRGVVQAVNAPICMAMCILPPLVGSLPVLHTCCNGWAVVARGVERPSIPLLQLPSSSDKPAARTLRGSPCRGTIMMAAWLALAL